MAKTAEEILIEKILTEPMDSKQCRALLKQYAAQEVEVYKKQLKDCIVNLVSETVSKGTAMHKIMLPWIEVLKIIDAVK